MRTLLILFLTLLVSCGVKHTVQFKETKLGVDVSPDFKKGAEMCDERYGYKTPEAELCFKDFRKYFSIEISATPEGIENYCEETYTDPVEIQECQDSLGEFFGGE